MPRSQPRTSSNLFVSPRITSHFLISPRISSHLLALPRISWYPLCTSSLLFLCRGASVGKCEPKRHAPVPASYSSHLLLSLNKTSKLLVSHRISSHLVAHPHLLVSHFYLLASPTMALCLRMRSRNLNDMPRCQVLILIPHPKAKVLMVRPRENYEPKPCTGARS